MGSGTAIEDSRACTVINPDGRMAGNLRQMIKSADRCRSDRYGAVLAAGVGSGIMRPCLAGG
jgi:hypothetical protein